MGRRVWEPEGHEQVKRLVAAGLTTTQIARLAGCTVDTVGRYARKLGLQPRRVRPSTTKWTTEQTARPSAFARPASRRA